MFTLLFGFTLIPWSLFVTVVDVELVPLVLETVVVVVSKMK